MDGCGRKVEHAATFAATEVSVFLWTPVAEETTGAGGLVENERLSSDIYIV